MIRPSIPRELDPPREEGPEGNRRVGPLSGGRRTRSGAARAPPGGGVLKCQRKTRNTRFGESGTGVEKGVAIRYVNGQWSANQCTKLGGVYQWLPNFSDRDAR